MNVITALNGLINGLDRLFTSDEERIIAETKKLRQEMKPQLEVLKNSASQIEINKIEAKHPNIFISGARPAILWIFVIALAYQIIVLPFLMIWRPEIPIMDTEKLWPMVSGMLGLAGWRTLDKVKGVARENFKTTT